MENLLTVAAQVGVLFALMAVGALCRWFRLVDATSVKGMVNVLLLVVTPCLIIDAFQRPFDSSMLRGFASAFLIAFLVHAALILVARVVFSGGLGGDAQSRPVLRLATVFSNAGFMGIPLEQAILGAEGVFYGIVYVVMFNIFIWSWGLYEMRSGAAGDSPHAVAGDPAGGAAGDSPHSGVRSGVAGTVPGERLTGTVPVERRLDWATLRPMVLNPGTVGVAVGLPLFLCSAQLPSAVGTPVRLLAGLNTPLAMLVVGFYLAGADFRRVVRTPGAYLAAAVRLVVFPLAMVACLFPLREHLARAMMLALVVAASAPVAAMVSMFSSKFGRDVDLSVGLVSGTTLLSILTMPPVIAFAMNVLP